MKTSAAAFVFFFLLFASCGALNVTIHPQSTLAGAYANHVFFQANYTIEPTPQLCFQEFAQVGVSCGALATGGYNYAGSWTGATALMQDGAYDTEAHTSLTSSDMFVNYSRPIGSLAAVWLVAVGSPIYYYNFTVPAACLFNASSLNFYVTSLASGTRGQCWNSTGWETIYLNSTGGNQIWEEGLYHVMPNASSGLSSVLFQLNAGNYSFMDDSLRLALSFENRTVLHESDSVVADFSKYSSLASILGGNSTTPGGKFGGAMQFSGSNYVDVGNVSNSSVFTLSFWAKLYSAQDNKGLLSRWGSPPSTGNISILEYCYQETANATSTCGGLSTGGYNISGIWTSYKVQWDGNWGTPAATGANSSDPQIGNFSVNYSTMLNSTDAAWMMKLSDENGNNMTTRNFTIPGPCFNVSNKVQLKLTMSRKPANCYGTCWNGTGWSTVFLNSTFYQDSNFTGTEQDLWEEGIHWITNTTIPVTYNYSICTNYTQEVNLTGGDQIYANYSNYTGNPIIPNASTYGMVAAPSTLYENGLIKMWMGCGPGDGVHNAICYANSTNGTQFTIPRDILNITASNSTAWAAAYPSVFKNGSTYFMTATLLSGSGSEYRQPHLFSSSDGLNWTDYCGGTAILHDASAKFNSQIIINATTGNADLLVEYGTDWMIHWYTATPSGLCLGNWTHQGAIIDAGSGGAAQGNMWFTFKNGQYVVYWGNWASQTYPPAWELRAANGTTPLLLGSPISVLNATNTWQLQNLGAPSAGVVDPNPLEIPDYGAGNNSYLHPLYLFYANDFQIGVEWDNQNRTFSQVHFGGTDALAYYKFNNVSTAPQNENDTRVSDEFGNNFGTLINGAHIVETGRYGKGLAFDGVNDFVNVSSPLIANKTNALTILVWVKVNAWNETGETIQNIIGDKRDSINQGWQFKISNTHNPEFAFWNADSGTSRGWMLHNNGATDSNVTLGEWNLIGFSFNGTYAKMILGRENGFLYIENESTPNYNTGCPAACDNIAYVSNISINPTQNLRIGHRQAAGTGFEQFNGTMDNLMIFPRALTADEILQVSGFASNCSSTNASAQDAYRSWLVRTNFQSSNNNLSFSWLDANGNQFSAFSPNEATSDNFLDWRYYSVVFNSTIAKVCVNSVCGTPVNRGAINASPQNLVLGNYNDTSKGYAGLMDELRYWTRGLSDDELEQQYYGNLNKFSVTNWTFQYYRPALGDYNYSVFANDSAGVSNQSANQELGLFWFELHNFTGHLPIGIVNYSKTIQLYQQLSCNSSKNVSVNLSVNSMQAALFNVSCNIGFQQIYYNYTALDEGNKTVQLKIEYPPFSIATGNLTYWSDLYAPQAAFFYGYLPGGGYGVATNTTIQTTVTDSASPYAWCNLTLNQFVFPLEKFNNNASNKSIELLGGTNNFYATCYDELNNTANVHASPFFTYVNAFLIDENTGGPFYFDNTSNPEVYMVSEISGSIYNFTGTNTTTINFFSNVSEKLRLVKRYAGLADILFIDIDPAYMTNATARLCVTHPQQFYEIVAYSVGSRPVWIYDETARCYILIGTTRYAYTDALMAKAYAISAKYQLLTIENGVPIILSYLDGSLVNFPIDLDALLFRRSQYDLRGMSDMVVAQKISTTSMEIHYKNPYENTVNVTLYVYDNGTEKANYNVTGDSDFSVLIDTSGFGNQTIYLIRAIAVKTTGATDITEVLFNYVPQNNALAANVAIVLAVLTVVFGITFVAIRFALGIFGLFIVGLAIALTTLAISNPAIIFVQVMLVIIAVFIFLTYKDEYAKVT